MVLKNTHCSTDAASTSPLLYRKSPIPVAVILGPTAVGKSAVAFRIAQEMGWDILSCDSRQIYRLMDIGTAKPSWEERKCVRHWMIDILNPSEEYSAGRFAREAESIIRNEAVNGKPLILCGGTGLYFRALSEGYNDRPQSDPAIRDKLMRRSQKDGVEALYKELMVVDPFSAQGIHKNDLQRIVRALALFHQTGKPPSLFSTQLKPPAGIRFIVVKMTMPRSELYERINRRVQNMIDEGLWDEFLQLRSASFGRFDPGMQTVGYKELFSVENGENSLETAIAQIQQNTRRYAKRQFTWFNNQVKGTTFNASTDWKVIRDFFLQEGIGFE